MTLNPTISVVTILVLLYREKLVVTSTDQKPTIHTATTRVRPTNPVPVGVEQLGAVFSAPAL